MNGEVQLTLDCEPVFDYGRTLGRWEYAETGYHKAVCRPDGDDTNAVTLTLTSDMNLGFEGPRAIARTLVRQGETRYCALSWGIREAPRTHDDAYRRLVWTARRGLLAGRSGGPVADLDADELDREFMNGTGRSTSPP